MDSPSPEEVLCTKVKEAINYVRMEMDCTFAQAIGCLDILKQELLREAFGEDDDD